MNTKKMNKLSRLNLIVLITMSLILLSSPVQRSSYANANNSNSGDWSESVKKAVIVAAGIPEQNNPLWNGTQTSANNAFRALLFLGYTKENIFYLSPDTASDADGNNIFDEVDADADLGSLRYAITQWASDADQLIVYISGAGGFRNFQMNNTEILKAEELDQWLDTANNNISGEVVFIYDSCSSGSFVPVLIPPDGKDRIILTSASDGEDAYFMSQGTLSYSSLFWSNIMNGKDFYDAYVLANNSISLISNHNQNPLLEADSDGIANQEPDKTRVQELNISARNTIDRSDWVSFSGKVLYNGSPVCAMVLANGQYSFSNSENGTYNMTVPLNEDGEIILYAFGDSLTPFKKNLNAEQTAEFEINMEPASEDSLEMTVTREIFPTKPGMVKIKGTVQFKGVPLCAMILANGKYMFTCDGEGRYEMEVPLDEFGEITLFGFCDGLQPYKYVLRP